MIKRTEQRDLMLFIGCFALFIVGWLKFLLPPVGIYVADYVLRIIIISAIISGSGLTPFRGPLRDPLKAIISGLIVLWGMLLFENLKWAFTPQNPFLIQVLFPDINDSVLRWGDAILGVALVAMSEELVFRYLPVRIGNARRWSSLHVYAISVVSFAAIHVPQGLIEFVFAALFGILAMGLYRRFHNLWVPILVHYLVDLVLFSDIACWLNVHACS